MEAPPDDPLQFADLALDDAGAGAGGEQAPNNNNTVADTPVFASPPPPPPPADDEPPPSYESVMAGSAAVTAAAVAAPSTASAHEALGAAAVAPSTVQRPTPVPASSLPTYTVRVTDPLKHGDGVSSYVSYKVHASPRTAGGAAAAGASAEVIRRYRDFAWLAGRLGRTRRGAILPPLPEKTAVTGRLASPTPAFVEGRRSALEGFLRELVAHPLLADAPDLASFLTAPEEEWGLVMARADHADAVKAGTAVDPAAAAAAAAPAADFAFGAAASGGGGGLAAAAPVAAAAKRRLGAALAGLRGLGASAAAFAAGKGVVIGPGDLFADATEDPAYLRARDGVAGLEAHLAEVARAVAKAVKKQADFGAALAELGAASAALARHEGPDAPRELAVALGALGERGAALGRAAAAGADRLTVAVAAPLAACVRSVKCARAAMADRGAAGGALAAARNDVDARRARLTRLRVTPGTREDKLAEAERDLLAAQTAAEDAKAEYEALVARMEADLPRWEAARAGALAGVLGAYAAESAAAAGEAARVWRGLGGAVGGGGGGGQQ